MAGIHHGGRTALDRFGGDSVVVWAGIHHGGRTALARFGGDSVVVWQESIMVVGQLLTVLVVTVSWCGQESIMVEDSS